MSCPGTQTASVLLFAVPRQQCNMNVETAIETLFGKIEDGSSEAESARADVLASQFAHTITFGEKNNDKAKKTHRVVWTPTDASIAAVAVSEGRDTGCGEACVILRGSNATPPVILGCDPGVSAEIVCAEGEALETLSQKKDGRTAGAGPIGKDGLFAAIARLQDSKAVEQNTQVRDQVLQGALCLSHTEDLMTHSMDRSLLCLCLLPMVMLRYTFRAVRVTTLLHACSALPSSCVDAAPITSFSTGMLLTSGLCYLAEL